MAFNKISFLVPLFSFLCFLISLPSSHAQSNVVFDRIELDKIFYRQNSPIRLFQPISTRLDELNYIGTLYPPKGLPYFIVSGIPCHDCMDNKAIYAIRPDSSKPIGFVYPGKILDPRKGLVFQSRSFFGKCLPNRADVYVVFQRERVDRRGMQSSVLIAQAEADHFNLELKERRGPSIRFTEKMVKQKHCFEIPGRNRRVLNKTLDLHPRGKANEDEESDDLEKVSFDLDQP